MTSSISLNLTGIDTDNIISQLMELERRPLVKLQTQQATLLTREGAWNAIRSKLDSLTSKIAPLTQMAIFSGKTATVSDASVLSASASTSAAEGIYEIQVTSLATAQTVQSQGFSSADDPRGFSGIIELNGKSITIASTDNLSTVAAKINATADVGASAAVLQTGTSEYKMIVTSSQVGVSGVMSFGGDVDTWKDLGVVVSVEGIDEVNEVKAAQDAAFTVNGVGFTRSGNSVSDAIPGLTLNLMEARDAAGAGGKATLTVSSDDQAVVSGVKSLVTEYNELLDVVGKYTTWDAETRKAGPLFGDSLLRGLLSEIRGTLFMGVSASSVTYDSLRSIGLSTGVAGAYSKDGKLTLDEVKLREALKADRGAVEVLLGARTANVALASNGSTVTASSVLSDLYPVSSTINGDTSSVLWGAGGGWSDGTPGDFNGDWLELSFGRSRTVDRVNVYTVDSTLLPAESYGLRDFNLQYWNGSAWTALGAPVTGSTAGVESVTFIAVTTDKMRLNVTASNDGQSARVVELEAYERNDGVLVRMRDIIDRYASADGFMTSRSKALDTQDKDLSRQIEDMQKRLDARAARLRTQYTALEITLQKLSSQSTWLTQQIEAMSRTHE